MINYLSNRGTGNLILGLIYTAIYTNQLEFFEETIGQNMVSILEEYTGVTLEDLKTYVYAAKNKKTAEELLSEETNFANMTIADLSKKYGLSESTIRTYTTKNNIKYKKNIRTSEELAQDIADYVSYTKGMCTISEIARHVGANYANVKKICLANNLHCTTA